MLKITNLNVDIAEANILEDINLEINEGEIHALVGPAGSGKSAFAHSIAGHPNLTITKGKLNFKRKLITALEPNKRSNLGIFVSFQHPPEIPNISNTQLIQSIFSARGEKKELTTIINDIKLLTKTLELGSEWHNKDFNLGASGLEARKAELVQMHLLDPSLVILDDIDSFLDESAVDEIAQSVSSFLKKPGKAGIIITQNATILKTIKPNHVHVMVEGRIVKSGDRRIINRIINNGYREFS